MNRRAFLGLSSAALPFAAPAKGGAIPAFEYGDLVIFDRSEQRPDSPEWRLLVQEHRDIAIANHKAAMYRVKEIRRMPTAWRS
jgi:hypothetical protein